MRQDYEDKRYLYFYQEEMDNREGELITMNDKSPVLEFVKGRDDPTYIYELVEVILPEEMKDHSDEKRPIKVTYV